MIMMIKLIAIEFVDARVEAQQMGLEVNTVLVT